MQISYKYVTLTQRNKFQLMKSILFVTGMCHIGDNGLLLIRPPTGAQ